MKGMKIRVLPSEIHKRTFELLGAIAMRMDLTEAIAMIKAGTLDAQENPLANTVTYGVHKFHKFHTLTNHFYISRPIFLHRTTFEAGRKTCTARCRRRSAMRSPISASLRSKSTSNHARRSRMKAAKSTRLRRPNMTPS